MTTTTSPSARGHAPRSEAGRALSPVTAALVRLEVGGEIRIPLNGKTDGAIRSRISNNIKTARLKTGHAFSAYTEGRALYVRRVEGR